MRRFFKGTLIVIRIAGIATATILAGIAAILIGSVLSADALARRHAFELAQSLSYTAEYVQSRAAADMAPLRTFSRLRPIAERSLKEMQTGDLSETLVGLDFERVGIRVLRVTVTTELAYPTSLIGLVGLTRRDLRAVSSREVTLRCMPADVPEAHTMKKPTIQRRWTGPLDWYLLGDASEAARTIDEHDSNRFDYLGIEGGVSWPTDCDAPVRKASHADDAYARSPDEVPTFRRVAKTLNEVELSCLIDGRCPL